MTKNRPKNSGKELSLVSEAPSFPSTRFQGSKLKIVDWIWDSVKTFDFDSALDALGGTGSVAYRFKQEGKQVTYNDYLRFNWIIGKALIENDEVLLTEQDIEFILTKHKKICYPTFIYDTFKDIYYTDSENKWLDVIITNISRIKNPYKNALAYFSLFQACISKRPFNLFHRKNLYIRFSNVKRNFGNKATWDKSFADHFTKFVNEANGAVFSNGKKNESLNLDVMKIEGKYDLVYIDTPYISKAGVGVDYLSFYHFLEGIVNYPNWRELIDFGSRHRKLKGDKSPWSDKNKIHSSFERLFKNFSKSILVVSYRSDGIPSIEELSERMSKYKNHVNVLGKKNYKYVLSNNNSAEVLIIGY